MTNYDSAPVDKIGIVRDLPRRWRLDAFNDGVYTAGLDRQYPPAGRGHDHRRRLGRRRVRRHRPLPRGYRDRSGCSSMALCHQTVTHARRQGRRQASGRQLGRPRRAMRSVSIAPGPALFTLDIDDDGASQDADDRAGSPSTARSLTASRWWATGTALAVTRLAFIVPRRGSSRSTWMATSSRRMLMTSSWPSWPASGRSGTRRRLGRRRRRQRGSVPRPERGVDAGHDL